MTVIVCPSFPNVTDAIEYLDRAGCTSFYLWRGPDGMVRGHGTKWIEIAGVA